MAGILGSLIGEEDGERSSASRAWVAHVREQWALTGAYRHERRASGDDGPVPPVTHAEWWETRRRIALAFNDIFACLGLEAATPGKDPGTWMKRPELEAAIKRTAA